MNIFVVGYYWQNNCLKTLDNTKWGWSKSGWKYIYIFIIFYFFPIWNVSGLDIGAVRKWRIHTRWNQRILLNLVSNHPRFLSWAKNTKQCEKKAHLLPPFPACFYSKLSSLIPLSVSIKAILKMIFIYIKKTETPFRESLLRKNESLLKSVLILALHKCLIL